MPLKINKNGEVKCPAWGGWVTRSVKFGCLGRREAGVGCLLSWDKENVYCKFNGDDTPQKVKLPSRGVNGTMKV